MMRAPVFAAVLLLSGPVVAAAQNPAPPAATAAPPASGTPVTAPAIENGSTVRLQFTITDEAGTLLSSNKDQEPLTFRQGDKHVVPGLERELMGLHPGDVRKVVLKPEDAFGVVDPGAQTEVPKTALPPDALTVGTKLMARNASGEGRPVVVKEIKDDTVIIDLNHPLAGKTLVFDVKVLGVEPPAAAESKAGQSGGAESKPSAPKPAEPTPGQSKPNP